MQQEHINAFQSEERQSHHMSFASVHPPHKEAPRRAASQLSIQKLEGANPALIGPLLKRIRTTQHSRVIPVYTSNHRR